MKVSKCTWSAGQRRESSRVVDGDKLGRACGLSLCDWSLPRLRHWSLPYLSLSLHLVAKNKKEFKFTHFNKNYSKMRHN